MRLSFVVLLTSFLYPALFLLEQCCHVKEVGSVKYKLVKDHEIKPDPTCKDDCVYQKVSSDADVRYYCFRPGKQSSECLENEEVPSSFNSTGVEKGILVVGDKTIDGRPVELLKDDGTFWCNLPDFPESVSRHTQNGLVACGSASVGAEKICYTFSNGTWAQSHKLQRKYYDHSSWESSQGIVLLKDGTTDILTETGSVDHFTLESTDSAYAACTIGVEDQDEVIITGGVGSDPSRTPVYNNSGFVRNYPGLNTNRYYHACGHFLNSDGNLVLLVTGGHASPLLIIDSTEILIPALTKVSWTVVGKLPSPRGGLPAVSLNNNVFVMGGYFSNQMDQNDKNETIQSEILKFNTETFKWAKIGDMQRKRSFHAVSLVSSQDVLPYCITSKKVVTDND